MIMHKRTHPFLSCKNFFVALSKQLWLLNLLLPSISHNIYIDRKISKNSCTWKGKDVATCTAISFKGRSSRERALFPFWKLCNLDALKSMMTVLCIKQGERSSEEAAWYAVVWYNHVENGADISFFLVHTIIMMYKKL